MKRYARGLAAALIIAATTPLPAQDYPRGAISLVIPLAPGDANDLVGRSVADEIRAEHRRLGEIGRQAGLIK